MEPTFEIIPVPRAEIQPRVVGPGRKERAYLASLERAERRLREERERAEGATRELAVAERLERACQRRIDRLEGAVTDERARTDQSEAAQKRLLLALGALQRENELLHGRVAALQAAALPARSAPRPAARSSFLARWLRRRAPRA